jgi:Zincin-like metallopeptidase
VGLYLVRPRRGGLYGLYEGIPLTRRGSGYNLVVPDRITIFWGPLVRDFPKQEALAAKVEKVVYHEIGHYFGLSEGELSHTRMKYKGRPSQARMRSRRELNLIAATIDSPMRLVD